MEERLDREETIKDEGTSTTQDDSLQLIQHLAKVKLANHHHLPQRLHSFDLNNGNSDPDFRRRTKVRDFITDVVWGTAARKAEENSREVGDDFFGEQQLVDHRGSLVRLTIGSAGRKVKKIGRQVKREISSARSTGGEGVALGASGKGGTNRRQTTATPLVAVEEENSKDVAASHAPHDPSMPSPSPVYSHLSLVDTPTNSSQDSFSSGFSQTQTLTTTEDYTTSNASLTIPKPLHLRPQPSRPPSSSASSYQSELGKPISHTLTLDESLPKPKRRDSRTDFSKRHHHSINPTTNFQRILDSRRRKAKIKLIGAKATIRTEEEMMDKVLLNALKDAGAVKMEQEINIWETDVLWECQRGLVPVFFCNCLTWTFLTALPTRQMDDVWFAKVLKCCFNSIRSTSLAGFHFQVESFSLFIKPLSSRRLITLHIPKKPRPSAYSPHDHPLPTPFWKWNHPTWLVDMGIDTDEAGWQYAARFGSHHWRGIANGWRSFARRRRWIRTRVYKPVKLWEDGEEPRDRRPEGIDWDALRNSEFADRETPDDGPAVGQDGDGDDLEGEKTMNQVFGVKGATALLPLSTSAKDDIFSWEGALDFADPFLSWSYIKTEGDQALREKKRAGDHSDAELWGVWRDAVVEINFRRVARVLRQARLDREKLGLWKWWLGVEGDEDEDQLRGSARDGDEMKTRVAKYCEALGTVGPTKDGNIIAEDGVPRVGGGPGVFSDHQERDTRRPAKEDVWDLLEGRVEFFPAVRLYLCFGTYSPCPARSSSGNLRIPPKSSQSTTRAHLTPRYRRPQSHLRGLDAKRISEQS